MERINLALYSDYKLQLINNGTWRITANKQVNLLTDYRVRNWRGRLGLIMSPIRGVSVYRGSLRLLISLEELDYCYQTTYLLGGTGLLLSDYLSPWRNWTIAIRLLISLEELYYCYQTTYLRGGTRSPRSLTLCSFPSSLSCACRYHPSVTSTTTPLSQVLPPLCHKYYHPSVTSTTTPLSQVLPPLCHKYYHPSVTNTSVTSTTTPLSQVLPWYMAPRADIFGRMFYMPSVFIMMDIRACLIPTESAAFDRLLGRIAQFMFQRMILFSNGMCAVIILLLSETTTTHSQIYAFCLYRSGFCQQNYVRLYFPSNKYSLREGSSSENMTRMSESSTHISESLSYISFPENQRNYTEERNNSSRIKETATIGLEVSSRNGNSSGNIENITRVTEISTPTSKQSQTPSTTMASIYTPTLKQSQTPSTTMSSTSTATSEQSQTPSTTMTSTSTATSEQSQTPSTTMTSTSTKPEYEVEHQSIHPVEISHHVRTVCASTQSTGDRIRHEYDYSACGSSGWKCKQNTTINLPRRWRRGCYDEKSDLAQFQLTPNPLRNPLCGLEEHLPKDGRAMEEGK
uniref:Uncharacterized protein n=1 Tax=Timema cristinae TaxID=61476 RepID=A0A7R9DAL8_TIMCR|nr:unnamed protein product [Timema cristinae]